MTTRSDRQAATNDQWIQLVKAVGIIAVVFGHAIYPLIATNHMIATIYIVTGWWSMPLFFIVGGFFLKPLAHDVRSLWQFIQHRLLPIFGTYLLAGVLLILASHFVRGDSWSYTGHYFIRLLYGGATLDGELNIFWFFTVYMLTLLIVTLLITCVEQAPVQFLIAIAMFALGVSYNSVGFLHFKFVPWGADLVLLTTLWMLCGYYGYKYWPQLVYKRFYATAGIIIYFMIVYARYEWGLNFKLYLKTHVIKTPFMAAFVPIFVVLALCIITEWFAKTGWFKWLLPVGWYAVPILYAHQLVMDVVAKVPALNHPLPLWFFGLMVPLVIVMLYHQIRLGHRRTTGDSES